MTNTAGGARQPKPWLAPALIVVGFIPALIIGWALVTRSAPLEPVGWPELDVGGEVIEYADNGERSLHLHVLGATPDESRPTAVFVHGARDDPGDFAAFGDAVVAAGGVAVLVEYSIFSEDADTDRQHEDVAAALARVRADATELGVDPERVTVVAAQSGARATTEGWTLGGEAPAPQLVLLSATHEPDDWPDGLTGATVTMLHGTGDQLIPPGRAEQLCTAMGDLCTLEFFDGGDHGFFSGPDHRTDTTERITELVVG